MLSKNYRLRNAKDIARVYGRGRYASVGILSVKAVKTHLSYSRVVVVVSKKVSKKATVRNTLRRRASAILAEVWQTVAPGYDIVVTVHEVLEGVPPSKLKSEIQYLLKKAQLANV